MSANDTKTEATKRRSSRAIERDEAIADLTKWLKRGTTVYVVLRKVSSSGMSRKLDLYYVEAGEIRRITWTVARAIECRYCTRLEALDVRGCGMDIGFHVVNHLSYALFKDGNSLTHRWL